MTRPEANFQENGPPHLAGCNYREDNAATFCTCRRLESSLPVCAECGTRANYRHKDGKWWCDTCGPELSEPYREQQFEECGLGRHCMGPEFCPRCKPNPVEACPDCGCDDGHRMQCPRLPMRQVPDGVYVESSEAWLNLGPGHAERAQKIKQEAFGEHAINRDKTEKSVSRHCIECERLAAEVERMRQVIGAVSVAAFDHECGLEGYEDGCPECRAVKALHAYEETQR